MPIFIMFSLALIAVIGFVFLPYMTKLWNKINNHINKTVRDDDENDNYYDEEENDYNNEQKN